MAEYSEADIAKIINDCEILILPENSTIEDVLASEIRQPIAEASVTSQIETVKLECHDLQLEDTEEHFERIFQRSKLNKNRPPDPEPSDFSHLTLLQSTSIEHKPNPERAMQINTILKNRLGRFRFKITKLIEKIDKQYRINNIFLEQAKSNDGKDATSFKSSYIKCGAPFFKDALSYPAPFNDDYKYRKNVGQEFFPFDLPTTSSRWKTKEKIALVKGVKNQMISHIKSKQSRRLCEASRKTRGKLQKLKFISNNKDLEQSPVLDIYESIHRDYPEFEVNWSLISFDDLQSSHSVSECMGMWYSYLRPDINREPFTDEEDVKIANAMCENTHNDWNDLAALLNNRSCLQTFVHFHATFSRLCPSKVRWSEQEDAKLMEAIDQHSLNGVINWGKVGNYIPTRNKTQCYNRYMILINSQGKKKGVFSRQEDRIILEYVKKMGDTAFNKMPKDFLAGRSAVQIRNHYNVALKHKGAVYPWTREEDKKLVDFVEKEGTNNWSKIAAVLGTHTRISCRTRYITISKFLSQNPGATIEEVPCKTKRITAVQKAASMSDEEDGDGKLVRSRNFGAKNFTTFKRQDEQMYEILRTTFNYDLRNREVIADEFKLRVLMWLFNESNCENTLERKAYMFTSRQLTKLQQAVAVKLEDKLVAEMKFATKHTQFLVPPNYNTSIGFRAITIKLHESDAEDVEPLKITDPTIKFRTSLENFQKLYFSMFYWTAMLSKVDKDVLNDTHFLKYPKTDMSAKEIFRELHKRKSTPLLSGFRPFEPATGQTVYPPAKKPKSDG